MNFSELYNSLITESSTIITSNEFIKPKGDFSAWVWADDGVIRLIVNDKTSQGHIGLAKKVIEYYNPEKFKELVTKYGNKVDAYYEFMLTYLGAARIAVYDDLYILMFHIDSNKISSQIKNWLYDLMISWKGKIQLEDGKFFTEDKKQALEHLKSNSITKNYKSPLLQFREAKQSYQLLELSGKKLIELFNNKFSDFSAIIFKEDNKDKVYFVKEKESHFLLIDFLFNRSKYSKLKNKILTKYNIIDFSDESLDNLTNKDFDNFSVDIYNLFFKELQGARIGIQKQEFFMEYYSIPESIKSILYQLTEKWFKKIHLSIDNSSKDFNNKQDILNYLDSSKVKTKLSSFGNFYKNYQADDLYNEESKNKAYVFDVDETLLHTSAKIQIFDKQTHEYIRSITPFEFTTEKLANNEVYLGDKSFTEFDSIDKDSTEPIAYTGKIIRNIFKHQKQDKIFILTARKNLCKQSIQDALKHFFNISLPIENIYTMGDSKGISISEAKKQVLEQLLTRFDEIEFFDDDKANIDKASGIPNVKTRLISIKQN